MSRIQPDAVIDLILDLIGDIYPKHTAVENLTVKQDLKKFGNLAGFMVETLSGVARIETFLNESDKDVVRIADGYLRSIYDTLDEYFDGE